MSFNIILTNHNLNETERYEAVDKLSEKFPHLQIKDIASAINLNKSFILQEGVKTEEAAQRIANEVRELGVSAEVKQYISQNMRKGKVEFTGQGGEYFKILIVNLFLTIITLGIYSAWAKVRKQQYLYGNTLVDGSSFKYLAKPITILKGRLIAVAVLLVFVAWGYFDPIAQLVGLGFIAVMFPLILVRSLKFNMLNTSYRNVRFHFIGSVKDAYITLGLGLLIVIVTLGFGTPIFLQRLEKFVLDNTNYGQSKFNYSATIGNYYRIYGIMIAMYIVGFLFSLLLTQILPVLGFIALLIAYLVPYIYFETAHGNLIYNQLSIEEHTFNSSMTMGEYFAVVAKNTALTTLTLGIYLPWAHCRMARYRAECLEMNISGDLDGFVAAQIEYANSLGEELGDAFDLEIAAI